MICFMVGMCTYVFICIQVWSGGLKSGSVHISGIFTDRAFTFVVCVLSQRKQMNILTNMNIKCSCFLEWQEVPEL